MCAAVKKDYAEFESDEELATLQRELVELALSNGVRDTEALNILVEADLDTPKKPG